ncbi:MAG: hypothetical protein IPP29_01330 [Bacteroidetes bacterium]|nr:hypothetical protein [Bacteroidota bacterium]
MAMDFYLPEITIAILLIIEWQDAIKHIYFNAIITAVLDWRTADFQLSILSIVAFQPTGDADGDVWINF